MRRFDRTSVIIKPKSEDKICKHINIKLRSKSMWNMKKYKSLEREGKMPAYHINYWAKYSIS